MTEFIIIITVPALPSAPVWQAEWQCGRQQWDSAAAETITEDVEPVQTGGREHQTKESKTFTLSWLLLKIIFTFFPFNSPKVPKTSRNIIVNQRRRWYQSYRSDVSKSPFRSANHVFPASEPYLWTAALFISNNEDQNQDSICLILLK